MDQFATGKKGGFNSRTLLTQVGGSVTNGSVCHWQEGGGFNSRTLLTQV